MAVDTTPLDFKVPDGDELIRNGDNVIAHNALVAQGLHQEERARLVTLESLAGFEGDPLDLNDSAVAQALAAGPESAGALVDALEVQVPPVVAEAIASDPTIVSSAATMAQSTVGLVPKWKASTAYVAGQMVINPSGDLVTAKVNFTSSSTYSATNWNLTTAASLVANALGNKGVLANGTDIDTLRTPGIYHINSSTAAATMFNLPFTTPGQILVTKDPGSTLVTQKGIGIPLTGGNISLFSRTTRSTTVWDSGWESDRQVKGALPDSTDLTTFAKPGTWIITSAVSAATMTGLPQLDGATLANVSVLHISTFPGISAGEEEITVYVEDGKYAKFSRIRRVATAWPTWQHDNPASTAPPVAVVSDSGLANAVRIQDFTQKMGGVKKVTTATVAFRYDHGLNNLNGICRPVHETNNWPYSIALCSGRWTFPENDSVTQATVNAWVVAGLAEIWNHSKDHGSGDNSEAAWKAAILDGLRELETQIPAAAGKIFGFAPPGSAGTDFGDFIFGQTLEEFVDTDGIRFILKYHAVAAGYLATKRVQDGMVRQGMGHITMDTYSLATVQTHVEAAKAGKTALQIMLHPSRLDTAGYMTSATYHSIMDYIKAEETAGRLEVVSPYQQLLCSVV